jgi:hypothetical protein
LLLLDNCVAQPHLDSLTDIQLEFLSPNITSLVQPLDMQIMQEFGDRISAKLVNYILAAIQGNLLISSSAAQKVSARTDILQAVQFYCQQLAKD